MTAQLARGVVRQGAGPGPEARVEPPLVVQVDQELVDVPGRLGDGPGVGVVHVEHLAVLGLQGVGAGGRGAHDGVAGAREGGQRGHVAARPPARHAVPAVADERQPAAHLRRHDDLEAVALQDGHGRRRDVRLVVVRRAAMEVDDGTVWAGQAGLRRVLRQRPVARPPGRREGASREGGQGGLAMDAQRQLHRPPWQPACSIRLASGARRTPRLPTRSVSPSNRSRMRWRQPSGLVRSTSRMTARARLLISAILTSAGQAAVQKPQPEHQSTVRSGEARCRLPPCGAASTASRNRWAWGPTYLGPGKRSVTRRTGQTVLHTLHLRHCSAERATGSARVMRRLARGGAPRFRTGAPASSRSDAAARQALARATPSPQRSST